MDPHEESVADLAGPDKSSTSIPSGGSKTLPTFQITDLTSTTIYGPTNDDKLGLSVEEISIIENFKTDKAMYEHFLEEFDRSFYDRKLEEALEKAKEKGESGNEDYLEKILVELMVRKTSVSMHCSRLVGKWISTFSAQFRQLKSRTNRSFTLADRVKQFFANDDLEAYHHSATFVRTYVKAMRYVRGKDCSPTAFFDLHETVFELVQYCEDILENHSNEKQFGKLDAPDPMSDEKYQSEVQELQQHWSATTYRGDTARVFLERLIYWESQVVCRNIYAKFKAAMNSSGVGKSRAIDEVGALGPLVVSIVLRNGRTDSGFPPGDFEVYEFFRTKIRTCENLWASNSLAYAFVEGLFAAVAEWGVERGFFEKLDAESPNMSGNLRYERAEGYDFKKFTKVWREDMKPVPLIPVGYATGKRAYGGSRVQNMNRMAELISKTRSEPKREFVEKLLKHAEKVFEEVCAIPIDSGSMHTSNFMQHQALQKRKNILKDILECLLPPGCLDSEFFILALDEAGCLFDKDFLATEDSLNSSQPGILYYNIRRVFGGLRDLPAWCVALSTKSNVTDLVPAQLEDPSARISVDNSFRVPPFTTFPLDVTMRENLIVDRKRHMMKPLSDYDSLKHLQSMGRILWDKFNGRTATHRDFNFTNEFILYKLLNQDPASFANQLFDSVKDKGPIQKCFALLASRISLDDFSTTNEARELIKDSVLSHLRILKTFDPNTGTAFTLTPSEPLVAQAASGLLHSAVLWPKVIYIVCYNLFRPGTISKGVKGEFFVLLLLILARDSLVNPNWRGSDPRDLKDRSPRQSLPLRFPAASHFPLIPFLKELLTDNFFRIITKSQKSGSSTTMEEVFKLGKLNFSHWVRASEHLFGDKLEAKKTAHGDHIRKQRELLQKNELLHLSMFRQAGIIMAPNQPEWDAALPVYFGSDTTAFDPDQLSCIFIQTKNVQDGFTPSRSKNKSAGEKLYDSDFSHFPGIRPTVPKLGLIFNIGYKGEPTVRILNHEDQNVWYFDIRGCRPEIFKCLNSYPDLWMRGCQSLLEVLLPPSELSPKQEDILKTCEPFSKITFAGQAGFEDEVRE